MMLTHDQGKRAKKARQLVVGERCYVLGPKNEWINTFIVAGAMTHRLRPLMAV